jgi:hypothetical protein
MRTSTNRCRRGRTGFARGIKTFLMLFLLSFFLIPTISAQTIRIDGITNSGGTDEWNQAGIIHIADKFNQINQDDIFAGNEKDFFLASNWFWKLGTAKDKNDIANGAGAIVPAGSVRLSDGSVAPGGPFLVFAGDRISNGGDAQIGFWFFQDGTAPVTVNGVNTFAPEKHKPPVIGDILVLADFTGGGRDGAITVLEWVETGGNYSENSAFNEVNIGAAVAENNAGTTPVPAGWVFVDKTTGSSTAYSTNEFYEGYVDLGQFGPGAACFSRFQLETRSSQEITSVLDDFVGGPLGGRPSVTVNSISRCADGPCVTLTATPGTAGTYHYDWTVPQGADDPGDVASFCATVAGQYCVTITNINGCTSDPGCGTVTVNPEPTANAGPDQAKCQGEGGTTAFTLAATAANGTTAWSQVGSTGTATSNITSGTSLTGTVNVTGTGTVTLRLVTTSTADPSCGTAEDEITLTVNANPTATAGPDEAKCQTKPSGPTAFTLAGTASNGTSAWSQVGSTGTASASITDASSPTSAVSVSGIGTVTLRLTTTSESCGTAQDDVVLTVNANPTAVAGDDQSLCQTAPSGPTMFTLAGSASNGTTQWAQVSATGTASASITDASSLTSTVSVSGVGSVTLRLTTTSTSCGTATDDVTLTVTSNPVADAGTDQSQCRNSVAGTNTFGTNTFNLVGTGDNGTVSWAIAPGGNPNGYTVDIASPTTLATAVNISGAAVNGGTVTLRLTITSESCGAATDDITLTLNALPLVKVLEGSDFCPNIITTGSVTLKTSENGVSYQLTKDGSPVQAPKPGNGSDLTWTGLEAGTYGVVGTFLATSCNTSSGPADVIENSVPDVTADNKQVCVGGSVALTGTPAGGTWSGAHVTGSTFDATGLAPGGYTVTYTVENEAGCITSDDATVTVVANPTATAGPDEAKCQTKPSGPTAFTLAGTSSGGTSAWAQVGSTGTASASITDASSPTSTVSVSGIGTVTLRITTTSASCGTAQDDVTLTVNANPTATAGDDQSLCQTAPSGPTAFTLAGTASNGTSAWSQVGSTGTASASIADAASLTSGVSVSGIGTVTLRLTTTSESCGTAQDDVVLTVNANPTAVAGDDQSLCQTAPSGPTMFTLAGSASNGTTQWAQVSATGTASASITDASSLTSTVSVSGVGSVTLRLTTTSTSCGAATDDVVLTVKANPTPTADDKEVCTGSSVELTGTPAGGSWSGDHVSGSTFNAAGVGAGAYTVTYTVTEDGCSASDDATVTVNACGDTFCSYTQGYYGNNKGTSCDGVTGGLSPIGLINKALENGGDIVIGNVAGRSVTFKAEAGIAAKINGMLPGGGTPGILKFDGDITINGAGSLPANFVSNYLTKQAKINNNLFSQTLALTMNSRLNSSKLASFELGSGWLSTQENNGCGEEATVVECSLENPGAIKSWQVKASVIDYLSMGGATPTVSSLLALANDVLAGLKTPGVDGVPSYSDITYMADLINNAFDECRTSLGFTEGPQSCPPLEAVTMTAARRSTTAEEFNGIAVSAYPNPYTDVVRFTIQSNVSGKAQLEVVNMVGQRLATVYNGMIQANKSQVVEYRVPSAAQQNLIYVLKIGGRQMTGKLLKLKR